MKFSPMMLVGREIKHFPWRWRAIIRALVRKYRKRGVVPLEEWDETFFRYAYHFCDETNRTVKHKAKVCGCFDCCTIFEPKKIKICSDLNEWIVFCPFCFNDTVIYDAPGIPLNKDFLQRMHDIFSL